MAFRTPFRARLVGAALLLGALATGCASPALLAGAQASQTGFSLYGSRDNFEAWHLVRYDRVLVALRRVAAQMVLEFEDEELGDGFARFEFATDTGETVVVEVQRQSRHITSTRFDSGWFNSPGLGRLMFKLMVAELIRVGAYPEVLDGDSPHAVS